MKTLKLARTAAAVLALSAGLAQAAFVTHWNVINDATFVPASVLPAGNTFPVPVLSNANRTLSWGAPATTSGLSELHISPPGPGVLVPTNALTSTVTVTHDNFPIVPGNSLTSVDIFANLTLQSVLPSAGGILMGGTTFSIKFLETLNAGELNGFCANGGLPGVGINSAGCADIFVLADNALNFPIFYDAGDGEVLPYFVSFFADGFGTLSNASCLAAGAAIGCRGFETAENQSSAIDFKILITATPFQTPEPGSIALTGLALAALGFVGRRRKQQK